MKSIIAAIYLLIGSSAIAQTVGPALPDIAFVEPQPIQMLQMAVPGTDIYADSSSTEVAASSIPFAPDPAIIAASAPLVAPGNPRSAEFKRFSANKVNRTLVATEFWARGLDAFSTHQKLTNSCMCYHEASRFFGLDMTPMLKTTVGAYSYSLGIATTYSFISAKLWDASKDHPRHARLLRTLSRALLIGDSSMEITADVHNLSIVDPGSRIN